MAASVLLPPRLPDLVLSSRNLKSSPVLTKETASMLYEFLFDFFDSIPTWSFFLYFLLLYLCLHLVVYQVLLLSSKFSHSDYGRRSYILCAVVEAGLLAFIR